MTLVDMLWCFAKAFITVIVANIPDNLLRYADMSESRPGVITLPDICVDDVVPSKSHAAVPRWLVGLYEPSLMSMIVPCTISCMSGSRSVGMSK